MTKEPLTLKNITEDLRSIAFCHLTNAEDWRFSFIVPITALAVLLGILLKNLWIGLLIFSVAAYHIVRYAMECKDYKAKERAIANVLDRGDVSVCVEVLSHIAEETIYEPHSHGRHSHATKTVTLLHFTSGSSWRIPAVDRHYEWSQEYSVSSKGLENISVEGDEFFCVSLQGHHQISYVYPCKFFVLDEELKTKSER
ncbi:MAG: hypothetical protein IJX28_07720 [Clostridia bacterium]|nr:hypothetical protein [Clostridia bacterium]